MNMPTCKGKLSDGKPCPKTVEEGQTFCRWHDPEDQSWRENYEQLERAEPEEKTDIILSLIEENPENRLELPKRDHIRANLRGIDFSRETLEKRREQLRVEKPTLLIIERKSADLSRANLQGADLSRANLHGANLSGAKLQDAILHDADLQDTILQFADLRFANLFRAELQKADLRGADLQGAFLRKAKLQGTILVRAKLQGVDLSDVVDMSNLYISDTLLDRTKIHQDKLGGAIGEEIGGDYSSAKRGYLALKQNFDDLGDYDAANWAYIKERQMEKTTKAPWRCRKYFGGEEPLPRWIREIMYQRWPQIKEWKYRHLPKWSPLVWWFWFKYGIQWAMDWFVEILCKYGESIGLVLLWIGIAAFGFAAYYQHIGGVWIVDSNGHPYATANSFGQYLLYSLGAFTANMFSKFEPADDRVRLVSVLQTFIGIFLVGLLGFVTGNRIRRS